MRTIRLRLTVSIVALITAACALLGLLSYNYASKALLSNSQESLTELAVQASETIDARMEKELATLQVIANSNAISSTTNTVEDKIQYLKGRIIDGYEFLCFTDVKGNSTSTNDITIEIADRLYFKEVMTGKQVVSSPLIYRETGKLSVVFAVPVYNNGKIIGMLSSVGPGDMISTLVKDIKIGENGYAYVIDREGTVVGHKDLSLVEDMKNYIRDDQDEPAYQELIKLMEEAIQGKSGFGHYVFNKIDKEVAYAPVSKLGMSVFVTVTTDEMLTEINNLKYIIFVISLIFILISTGICIFIGSSVGKPIKVASKHMKTMAEGNFVDDIPQKYTKNNTEVGIMARAMDELRTGMTNLIYDMRERMTELSGSAGNVDTAVTELLAQTEEISAVIEQMAAGFEQTAASAQEVSATTHEMTTAAEQIAIRAQDGAVRSGEIMKTSGEAITHMRQIGDFTKNKVLEVNESLKVAVKNAEVINKIDNLTNVILGIASQTNLLSLNAAIEAARAGEQGKGFAVVANEVKELAENSKRSAAEIREVVKDVKAAVEELTDVSVQLFDVLDKEVKDAFLEMFRITEAYQGDATFLSEMMTDLSAISEEISASTQNVATAIDEVAKTVNEGAIGIENIAVKTNIIVDQSEKVKKGVDVAGDAVAKLGDSISKFKVV